MALEVVEFVKGKCFICSKKCDKEGYCHHECAEAYHDKMQKEYKRLRENEG